MKTRDDFKPDLDFNLKDWVQDALLAESVDKREPPQFTDESIDQLMKQVYEKIEREALTTYHSNEPWALRQWALGNIMRDEIANEASNEIAHNLISPVLEWQQQQPFDPISKFHEKLVADGKSKHSIKGSALTHEKTLLSILLGYENMATPRKLRSRKLVRYILQKKNILRPLYVVSMSCYRNSSDSLRIEAIGKCRYLE